MIRESIIKDPALAPDEHKKIDWVAQHAPVLNRFAGERLADGSLRGKKIAMTIHLEAKTAYFATSGPCLARRLVSASSTRRTRVILSFLGPACLSVMVTRERA